MITIDISKFIEQMLPVDMRQPINKEWLKALLAMLTSEWNSYISWRADKYYEAHVTAQTISLQAYLNRLFDPDLKRIRISHGEADDVFLSLWSEPGGDYIDADDGAFLFLDEETSGVLEGFIVDIPVGVDKTQVAGIVDMIKAAGVNYEIRIIMN